jgi:UDP-N-acetylmuramoyl-tripeptide--D-alanyl-D-alanine ligase
LITNIGTAHLQKLGSVREIALQKSRIFSRFDGTQTALVNEDETWKDFLAKKVRGNLFLYGLQSTSKIESVQSLGIDGWKIRWNGIEFDFPLPGDHNLKNLCASLAICGLLNLDPQSAVRGLSKVSLPPGRLQIHRGKFLLIEDCYNANPDSMKMGLNFFASLNVEGKKIAVLGDMKELGKISRKEHENVGRNASECGLDRVFFFGEAMKLAYAAFCKNKKAQGTAEYVDDYDSLRKKVGGAVREGDALYLKASRSMKLERLTVDILGNVLAGGAA